MPLPGDRIIGYVTRGRGVSIHKASCTNAQALLRDAERIVDVEWVNTASTQFLATICVKARDRDSLLLDVSKALISLNISLKQLNTQTLPDGGGVLFTMTFEVNNVGQLDTIIGSIRKVEGIIDVTREK